jgi:phosphate transport system substrate-binding protein
MRVILTMLLSILALPVPTIAETIKIAGSGQMLPLASKLAIEYKKKYPDDTIFVNANSLGHKGGVQAVSNGQIDIATSARRLDDDEQPLPVQAYEVATVAGFFAVNPTVPIKGLTSKQICGIYSGKIRNWKELGGPDAAIVAFTRPEEDSTKILMRSDLPGFAQLKEAPEVISVQKSRDLLLALIRTPYAIGMTDAVNLANFAGKMVALKLDGRDITSSISGPLLHRYSFVIKKKPRAADLRFIDFVYSPAGQAVIEQSRAHPLKPAL